MGQMRNKYVDDLAIALMHLGNSTPSEIAERLKISLSKVSRSEGRTDGHYWKKAGYVPGAGLAGVPEALMREARQRIDANSIRAVQPVQLMRFAGAKLRHLKSVEVVPRRWEIPAHDIAARFSAWMHDYGRLAAPKLKVLLAKGKTWGVTWGSHVSATVDALAYERESTATGRRVVSVLPLCGNRFGTRLVGESSSAIAERLGLRIAGEVALPGALAMVPAFILGDLTAKETIPMWKQIARSDGYCRIFGTARLPAGAGVGASPEAALADTLDGILTSVSRTDHPFGFGASGQLYENAGYDEADITRRYLGDIGGVGLQRADRAPDRKLEKRWTGLTREQLLGCAARAARPQSDGVGVVVVTSGADRTECVIESVRRGYVSHLIIDEALNEELYARASKRA